RARAAPSPKRAGAAVACRGALAPRRGEGCERVAGSVSIRKATYREGEAPAEPQTARKAGSAGASPSHFPERLSDRGGDPGLLAQGGGLVGPLPGELRQFAAEVAVPRRLVVDRPAQVQRLDDAARRQLEV